MCAAKNHALQIYNTTPPSLKKWFGRIVLALHRASGWKTTDADSWTDNQHMSLSSLLLWTDNRVDRKGVFGVEKVDLIASDS